METRADKIRATAWAIALHLALIGLMVVGVMFQSERKPLSVAGGAIEAVLTETLNLPSAPPPRPQPKPPQPQQQQQETAPPPQPKPEPRPQNAPEPPKPTPQSQLTRPDTVDQERIVREAAEKAENARREQEERRRQEQVQLEEKRKQEEAERRQRLAQQQAERDKQLADIRRQREEAQKRREREEQRLQQLADLRAQNSQTSSQANTAAAASARASDQPLSDRQGNQGVNDDLSGRYALAIQQQVDRNWLRPDSLRPGLRCFVQVTQMVGGQVTAVDFTRCPADAVTQRSIEAALMREPLPYRGYENVYQRRLNIPFCYPVEACER